MPDNVCLGTTITGDLPHEDRRLAYVREFQAPVRFLSIEPLGGARGRECGESRLDHHRSSDRPGGFQPEESWVQALEDYADERGIPVYEKDNLKVRPVKRQEWPTAVPTISHSAGLSLRATSRLAAGVPVVLDGACRRAGGV